MRSMFAATAAAALIAGKAAALDLNVNDQSSIKGAAKNIAKDLMGYYTGNTDQSKVGLLPSPYYWWEAGAMFGTMIGYSYLTGDTQYDEEVAAAIFSQASPTKDFMMMSSQASDLGNDDQAFWGLTAMSAAEHNLTAPSGQSSDIWVTLASGAFNDLMGRWNDSSCGGGIKWQFIQSNNGYNYKSSIANAATMQLGARLALLTGNQTYADGASKIYDWMTQVGFISSSYQVFDGAGDGAAQCKQIDLHEWSYNSASLIGGCAAMAAHSSGDDVKTWTDRTTGLWQHATENFFQDGVLYEQACEGVNTCDVDEWSFKAYLARWATFAGQIVPSIMDDVQSKLQSTATAMAKSCTGGSSGNACGTMWYNGTYNSNTGVGQEMSALEVTIGLLGKSVPFKVGAGNGSGSDAIANSASNSASPSSSGSAASSAAASGAQNASTAAASAASSGAAPTTLQKVVATSGAAPGGSSASGAAAASATPSANGGNGGNGGAGPAPTAAAAACTDGQGAVHQTVTVTVTQ